MSFYLPRAERFIENYNVLSAQFKTEDKMILMLGALMYLNSGKQVETTSIIKTREYLRDKTAVFSSFRGINELIIAMMANCQSDDRVFIDEVLATYDKLKSSGFKTGSYLPLAAVNVLKNPNKQAIEVVIERMSDIYQKMKQNHFWLTGQDDYVYAAILATTLQSVETISEKTEYYYQMLAENGFSKNNGLQSLSHILAVGDKTSDEMLNDVIMLQKTIKAMSYNIKHHALPSLAILSMLNDNSEKLANNAVELANYLAKHQGFGDLNIDKNMRFSVAVGIITDYFMDDASTQLEEMVLTSEIQSLIIAQTIAISTALMASTASIMN